MTQTKPNINEIFFLRAIACMAIVLLHSIDYSVTHDSYFLQVDPLVIDLYNSVEFLLKFGTPAFIFISELLLSYAYSRKTPQGFLTKRIKFIVLPFISMAIFYAFYPSLLAMDFSNFFTDAFLNILGGYHGYFVLIIFQFYIIHMLFTKIADRYNPKKVLILSFVVNASYLSFFTLTEPLYGSVSFLWDRWYFIFFFGWIFYFFLAYYCGKNYDVFLSFVKKQTFFIWLFSAASIVLVLFVYHAGIIGVPSSKRPDMILLTSAFILLIYHYALKVKNVPTLIIFISKYSFGIYLLHVFYIRMSYQVLEILPLNLEGFNAVYLFVSAIVLSTITVYIANHLPFGKYIVGKPGAAPMKEKMS